jgi:hypothetical protein
VVCRLPLQPRRIPGHEAAFGPSRVRLGSRFLVVTIASERLLLKSSRGRVRSQKGGTDAGSAGRAIQPLTAANLQSIGPGCGGTCAPPGIMVVCAN